jgi:Flp pilus assembly pilin Flp
MVRIWQAAKSIRALAPDCRGVAAIEFAFFAGLLSVGMLNVVDVSIYAFQRMEVDNATQVAAQAAWKACDTSQLPATTNCPGLSSAVTTAVQSTSLGSKVQLQTGSPAEGYYCVNSSGAIVYVSSVSSKPADCSSVGMASLQPADYLQIQTKFTYAPLFKGITIGHLLPTQITSTALMRMG